MSGYPSRQEFFAYGLPSKAITQSSQAIASTDATADVFTAPAHGLVDGDRVRFTANAGGAGLAPGVLPAGLSASTLYYVVGVATLGGDMFQVSTSSGGAAVNVTDAGSGLYSVVVDYGARIDRALDAWSRHADQHLKAYTTPLVGDVPLQLKMWICQLAAYDLATSAGLVDPEYAKDPALAARAQAAQQQLDRLDRDGNLLAGIVVDQTPDTLDNAAQGFGDAERCWSPGGLI